MKKVRFASHLKAKVRHHGPPCYARAQPWLVIHVFNNNSYCGIQTTCTVILLQIVMVSPGTHLVKNHESLLSITNESQFKITRSLKLKMLWLLCKQTINLEADAKTLFYSLLKLKCIVRLWYLKHKKDKQICIFKQQPQKSHGQDIMYECTCWKYNHKKIFPARKTSPHCSQKLVSTNQ